jgi:hypothetical protein
MIKNTEKFLKRINEAHASDKLRLQELAGVDVPSDRILENIEISSLDDNPVYECFILIPKNSKILKGQI